MDGFIKIDIIQEFQSEYEGLCLELLHQGYQLMLSEGLYDIDWEEDSLSLCYIEYMKKCPLRNEKQISIEPQSKIYKEEHIYEGVSLKGTPIIDMKFIRWVKHELHYYAEAKNLSVETWYKKEGSEVNASYYNNRYVTTGIEHFLSSYYPSNSCLVGYVLNGSTSRVLQAINKVIERKSLNPKIGFIEQNTPPQYKELYTSVNQLETGNFTLKHLFLQLYTQEHKRNAQFELILTGLKKKIDKADEKEKSRIDQQISLLEFVKNEKFKGESGVLRINLAWNTTDDLDLHAETEEGKIAYDNKNVGFGELDIDANANEPYKTNPQENIVFSDYPKGKCKVKVSFFASREKTEVDFVLSILTPNDDIKVFLKRVEDKKDIEVAEFEFIDKVIQIS
jgi:hypothetical protein